MEGMVRMGAFEFALNRYICSTVAEDGALMIQLERGGGKAETWTLSGPNRTPEKLDEAIAKAQGTAAEELLELRRLMSKLSSEAKQLNEENRELKILRRYVIEARDQLMSLRYSAFWDKLHLVVKQRLGRARNELYKAIRTW